MIILQAFHWDCLKDWWGHLDSISKGIADKGFDTVWLPPPSKGMNGEGSMGYDVMEHYNLNSRFGDKESLTNLINSFHEEDVGVMADLVMGHMLGGDLEYNPDTDCRTYTKFDEPKFPKNYKHFKSGDEDVSDFGETIDYYSDDEHMKDGLIQWASWLKEDIGFDSFRLDNLKDMDLDFVNEFTNEFEDEFIVGEYWSGDTVKLQSIQSQVNIPTFNFPLFYKLKEMCMNPDYPIVNLTNCNSFSPCKKVNFVANHDIERGSRGINEDAIMSNKELAYAYIFFQDNPVVVFWNDYFRYDLKDKIDRLIKVRKDSKDAELQLIHVDNDIYHAKRGKYSLIINNSKDSRSYRGLEIDPQSYIILD